MLMNPPPNPPPQDFGGLYREPGIFDGFWSAIRAWWKGQPEEPLEEFPAVKGESIEERAGRLLEFLLPTLASRDAAVESVCAIYPKSSHALTLQCIAGALYVLLGRDFARRAVQRTTSMPTVPPNRVILEADVYIPTAGNEAVITRELLAAMRGNASKGFWDLRSQAERVDMIARLTAWQQEEARKRSEQYHAAVVDEWLDSVRQYVESKELEP